MKIKENENVNHQKKKKKFSLNSNELQKENKNHLSFSSKKIVLNDKKKCLFLFFLVLKNKIQKPTKNGRCFR